MTMPRRPEHPRNKAFGLSVGPLNCSQCLGQGKTPTRLGETTYCVWCRGSGRAYVSGTVGKRYPPVRPSPMGDPRNLWGKWETGFRPIDRQRRARQDADSAALGSWYIMTPDGPSPSFIPPRRNVIPSGYLVKSIREQCPCMFDGEISNVKTHNRAFTDEEVAGQYREFLAKEERNQELPIPPWEVNDE